MIEINKIYNGDCMELMPLIADKSIDMVLCDLPYGTTACAWDTIIPFDKLWQQYERIIKDNGAIVLTASQPFTSYLVTSNIKWFKYELNWNKMCGKNPGLARFRPLPAHENVLIFGKGRVTYNPQMREGEPYTDQRSKPSTILNGNEHKFGWAGKTVNVVNTGYRYPISTIEILSYNVEGQHPTQKPVELFEYLIKTYSNEGELILDNCCGSGTTGIACQNTKRNFICMEQDKNYFDKAEKRLNENKNLIDEKNRQITLF